MRVTEIRPEELGETERETWDSWLRAAPLAPSPFRGWRFAVCAGDVREDARIAVIEDDAGLLGFLPYHRRPGGLARPIGAPFSDQHGPVTRPGAALDLPRALRTLKLSAYIHTAMPGEPGGRGGTAFSSAPAWVSDLGGDGAAYLERKRAAHPTRSKGFGKRLRKAERQHGPAAIVMDDQDPAVFERIVALKRTQFRRTGRHDVLGPRWVRAMLERLNDRAEPGFGLRMATLRLGGAFAAGEINLLGAGTLHSWLAAYEPDFSECSPGMQLTLGMLTGAASLGAVRIDFGCGHDHYKTLFADPEGCFVEGAVYADTAAGRVRHAAAQMWSATEHAPLGPAARFAGKLRRRATQIAAVETDFPGRARGVLTALSRGAPHPP